MSFEVISMDNIILQTHSLTKKYGEFTALNKVSLTLRKGEIYGLIGRNGAGKTTFFKCVMGLAKPTNGYVKIGAESNLNIARRSMGFMINPSFFPYLNSRENLEYLCKIKGFKDKNEVNNLLKLVGLDKVKKPFKAFSLGMKQRLGLAGAMLGSPSVVVLDEPINGLDPQGIADIREIIKNVNKETGTTFIVSSHILSELDMTATTFGFIESGVLIKEISHEDLHKQTQKIINIEVNDTSKAISILKTVNIEDAQIMGNNIILETHLNEPNKIARTLINGGIELYDLHRKETTLEEYFISLIGGVEND